MIKPVISLCFVSVVIGQYGLPPDYGLSTEQLIKRYGYPFESHTVTTSDGYILQMHRVPHRRNETSYNGGPPVLIIPGALSSSADYVNNGLEHSLGFILADHGYDVWLGNNRGIMYSRKHTTLNPDADTKEFWDFSFQEMAAYDLPAFIDHILDVGNQEKLFYIGHSQGTTSFFALASERPEYGNKVRLMVGLGPAAYFGNTNMFIVHFLADHIKEAQNFIKQYQFYELPSISLIKILGGIFCSENSPLLDICSMVFYIMAGPSNELNKSLIPVYATNAPAGASTKQWLHYTQLYISKRFCKYDYGKKKNMKIYGQTVPPSYNLSRITTPVALYVGDSDIYCSKQDVEHTASEIPNVAVKRYIPGFNHLDVIWGNDAPKLIFREVLQLMERI